MRYGNGDWDEVVGLLKEAGDIALACHVNPDGDALGSLLAVSMGLRKLGARTYPSWGTTPVVMPPAYAFLPGADTLVQPRDVPKADVFVALDCGAADRLGDLEDKAKAAPVLINVDHHPGNEDFGTHNVVVTHASSTAELAAHLLTDAGVDFDRDIATALYTGVVTDTGRFQYSNSTPETLRLAADLLERGVSAPEVAIEVFESAPYGFLKLTGRVLERAVLFEDERFIYSWVEQSDLAETGVAMDETEKLIDVIRATNVADVAAIFKEQKNGEQRVSLRSKGPVSVGAIARARGGGGHELAAGFTAADVHETAESIRRDLAATRTAP
ncbi:MAG TPA: bifunctional oligoribonuclease/PAP phosphatase NrnA [Actinomycetota bacterium]|nr:bifunctional oligoribonuclease/PAP phosphatase NrnA [Actinomycetota bacterium]